ncbi:hypothetical protein D3C86_2137610 [compost metagenome]
MHPDPTALGTKAGFISVNHRTAQKLLPDLLLSRSKGGMHLAQLGEQSSFAGPMPC